MTTIDIENMTADELKAAKAEAAEAVKDAPELANRYVQARLDAKLRDEKLAEQGRTITALTEALDAAKQRATAAEQQAKGLQAQAANLITSLDEAKADGEAKVRSAVEQLRQANEQISFVVAERDAARGLAKQRRAVLAQLSSTIAPLLADEG